MHGKKNQNTANSALTLLNLARAIHPFLHFFPKLVVSHRNSPTAANENFRAAVHSESPSASRPKFQAPPAATRHGDGRSLGRGGRAGPPVSKSVSYLKLDRIQTLTDSGSWPEK